MPRPPVIHANDNGHALCCAKGPQPLTSITVAVTCRTCQSRLRARDRARRPRLIRPPHVARPLPPPPAAPPLPPGKNPHAVALGRLARGKTSPAKAAAARANGRKGGAPRGPRRPKGPALP